MPQTVLILYSLWHYATYCIVFPALFYSYTLSQISPAYLPQAFGYADIIAKQLQRNNASEVAKCGSVFGI